MKSKTVEVNISENTIVVASVEQISSDLGGEAVILNLKSGVYHGLNEVGTLIWNLIQTPTTVKDIKAAILAEYEVEAERCDRDLLKLLEDLLAAELINIQNDATV
ncbi:PqqD family peptide modification chaperone [Fischerella thermalis]|uniref:PqqD family protein n=1 Tax=Fischerella thermalis CCMEE 5318 TaxID=2019666 RepID=A0A2N6LLP4_9CYAN|nr:PqqD family peptide modification chaperone [Fischerella thermalis]PMB26024.1 PqqD family protein [Fischerella thermalis CCMEE 5318]PMB38374.1 PqqD family protein [Fischerella thermalis CCMEE 5319]